MSEREESSRGLEAQRSIREIARRIDRAPSTVSREIVRNAPLRWMYRAHRSEEWAWHRALRPKPCRLAQNPILARLVAQKLESDWSPLVERHSRFVMLVKVPSRDTEVIVKAPARDIQKLPRRIFVLNADGPSGKARSVESG